MAGGARGPDWDSGAVASGAANSLKSRRDWRCAKSSYRFPIHPERLTTSSSSLCI